MSDAPDNTAEAAVRKFLEFVADPASARDEALITSLNEQVSAVRDPIQKLKLLAALDRAEKSDGEALRHGFVLHARHWADQEGIPLKAFREIGVNDIVLAEAGFDLGMGRLKGAKGSSQSASKSPTAVPASRAKAVSGREIRHWMLAQTDAFTLAQVMAGAGGSLGTITNVADELIESGQIIRIGPSTTHTGRGRAPYLYGRP